MPRIEYDTIEINAAGLEETLGRGLEAKEGETLTLLGIYPHRDASLRLRCYHRRTRFTDIKTDMVPAEIGTIDVDDVLKNGDFLDIGYYKTTAGALSTVTVIKYLREPVPGA